MKDSIFSGKKPFHKKTVFPDKQTIIKAPSYHVLFYFDEENDLKRYYAYALDFGIVSHSDLNDRDENKAISEAYDKLNKMVIYLIVDYLINSNIDHLFENAVPHEENEWGDYGKLSQNNKIQELKKSYAEFMDRHKKELLTHEKIDQGMKNIDESSKERFNEALEKSLKRGIKYNTTYESLFHVHNV